MEESVTPDPSHDIDDWDQDSLENQARWIRTLHDVAAKAADVLPDTGDRLKKAFDLVLHGHVQPSVQVRGGYTVGGPEEGTTYTVNGACTCPDHSHAPGKWCKHRLAVALYRRTHQEYHRLVAGLQAVPPREDGSHKSLLQGDQGEETELLSKYSWTKGDKVAIRYAGLLLLAKKRGLISIEAHWTYNDVDLSLAVATVTFRDGTTWTECGDATPANVTGMVKPHFRRMALTRAKARALRDALGLDMVSVEELED